MQRSEFELRMDDGLRLPAILWAPVGPWRGAALALHSFGDYRRAFDALGPTLALAGIGCLAFDQRGFGETAPFGCWAGNERYVRDAAEAARWLRRRFAGPVFGIGESLGGAVALLLAARRPNLVAALALANPAVRRNHPYRPHSAVAIAGAGLVAPLASFTVRRDCPHAADPARVRLTEDPCVLRRIRFDTLRGAMQLSNEATAAARAVRAPTLVLYGEIDWLIAGQSIAALIQDLGGPVAARFYGDLPHLPLQSRGRARVNADVARWLTIQANRFTDPISEPPRPMEDCRLRSMQGEHA